MFTWPPSPSSVSVSFLLLRTPVLLDLGPNLIQYNLILTNYICKEPISKSSHILRFWERRELWGDTFKQAYPPLCHAIHLANDMRRGQRTRSDLTQKRVRRTLCEDTLVASEPGLRWLWRVSSTKARGEGGPSRPRSGTMAVDFTMVWVRVAVTDTTRWGLEGQKCLSHCSEGWELRAPAWPGSGEGPCDAETYKKYVLALYPQSS